MSELDHVGWEIPDRYRRSSGILLLTCGAAVILGSLLPWAAFGDVGGYQVSEDLYQLGPVRTDAFFGLTNGSTAYAIAMVVVGTIVLLSLGLLRVSHLRLWRWVRSPWIILPGPILVVAGGLWAWKGNWWLVPHSQVSLQAKGPGITILAGALTGVAIALEVQGLPGPDEFSQRMHHIGRLLNAVRAQVRSDRTRVDAELVERIHEIEVLCFRLQQSLASREAGPVEPHTPDSAQMGR